MNPLNSSSQSPQTPLLAVDAIIEFNNGIILIERKNEPFGWALPGGFVDKNKESADEAVVREVKEETNLDVISYKQFKLFSNPQRDPRSHTATMVYIIQAQGDLQAHDDAKNIKVVCLKEVESMKLAFDHKDILEEYLKFNK